MFPIFPYVRPLALPHRWPLYSSLRKADVSPQGAHTTGLCSRLPLHSKCTGFTTKQQSATQTECVGSLCLHVIYPYQNTENGVSLSLYYLNIKLSSLHFHCLRILLELSLQQFQQKEPALAICWT